MSSSCELEAEKGSSARRLQARRRCSTPRPLVLPWVPRARGDMDVVLADDSDVSRRMLAATLERCGHRVIAVADGEAAWAAFEQRRPPMLILDWQMPGIDGLEVCRRVRGAPGGADVFVLMVTGRDSATHLGDALAAGVDDYVTKPVVPLHLEARVRIAERRIEQALARRSAEEALATAQWLAGI